MTSLNEIRAMRSLTLGLTFLCAAPALTAQTQNLVFITNAPVPGVATPGQAGSIGDGTDSDDTRKVVVFDVDFDGDEDVLFLNHDGFGRGLLNDGFGAFTVDTASADDLYSCTAGVGAKGVAVGDADGDGDADVFIATGPVGGVQQANVWLANTPGPFTNFQDVSAFQPAHVDHSYDAAFLQLDGMVALAVANRMGGGVTGQNRLYVDSNLDGVFETVAPSGGEFASDQAADVRSSRDLVVADFDGDGLDDVFVANAGAGGHENMVFRQAGGALVLDGVAAFLAAPGDSYGAAAADLDADGLPDLLVANRLTPLIGEGNHLLRNTSSVGDVAFVAETASVLDDAVAPSYDVTFGDLDQDGDLDLIVANNATDNAIYMNNGADTGAGAFTAGGFTRITDGLLQANGGRTRSAVIAEFGDYGPDGKHQGAEVVLANTIGGRNEFYRGMGKQFAGMAGGTNGDISPRLHGDGFFSPTTGGALVVTGGQLTNNSAILLMDIVSTVIPWQHGALMIDPSSGTSFVSSPFHLGPDGTAELPVEAGDIPAELSGMQIFAQVFTRDDGLPTRRGLTNALSIVVQ